MITSSNVHVIDFSKAGSANKSSSSSSSSFNPLNVQLRTYIMSEFHMALQNPIVQIIALTGGPKNFSAGADLTEFSNIDSILSLSNNNDSETSTTSTTLSLIDVVNAIEKSNKPVVAIINGVCLGGGLELALACHYRIVVNPEKTLLGLPEVHVGVIPGAGGTQRLPRLIGLQNALQMILTGKPIKAKQALKFGLIDNIISNIDNMKNTAAATNIVMEWVMNQSKDNILDKPTLEARRTSQIPMNEPPPLAHGILHAASLALPKPELGGEGMHAALQAVRAACTCQSFQEGMQAEGELFIQTLLSDQGAARRHAFFAIRNAQKLITTTSSTDKKTSNNIYDDDDVDENTKAIMKHPLLQKDVSNVEVGVIGAGTMGGGIALVLLQTGYKVYLVDINENALKKGVDMIHATIQSYVTRKRMTTDQGSALLYRLKPTQSLHDLKDCHLVVEAVIENMNIKHKVLRELNSITKSTCVLVSNTSTLDIDQMGQVLDINRRSLFAGWHFFSPAHVMKLVEIVTGFNKTTTSASTIALLQQVTKKIKKIGVIVGTCDGFVGNRMLKPYVGEMVLLLVENVATINSIDYALQQVHGFIMAPFQMADLAGNDIAYNIRVERGWVRQPGDVTTILPNRPARYTELADDMVSQLGRLGQKASKGWYDYNPDIGKGRKAIPSQEVSDFIEKYKLPGTQSAKPLSSQEIIERLLYPLVNEGFKILEEGIALQPSDIDVIWLFGYGFPAHRGGPMYWADHEVTLSVLLHKLRILEKQFPNTDHYVPSKLLERCVELEMTVEEFYKQGLHNTDPVCMAAKKALLSKL